MKYIKTQNNEIVLFPETLTHSQFRHLLPISAGFVSGLFSGEPTCFGSSISLGLSSAEEDSEILRKQIRGY